LGGVDESKFEELQELGFEGVALLGAVWNADQEPLGVYLSARKSIKNLATKKTMVHQP
jgi:thiamine-phosphate pyrophosphorylase